MGGTLSTIGWYLGLQDVETYNQVAADTEKIHQDKLENKVNQLAAKIDKDEDNFVTKEELDVYFAELSAKLDSNKDGVVSKDELEVYVQKQLQGSEAEIQRWKRAYDTLFDEYEELKDSLRQEEGRVLDISNISTRAIKDYVQSEIIDNDSNLKYVPDVIERKMYVMFYRSFLQLIEKITHDKGFELVNHRFVGGFQPIIKDNKKKNKDDK